MQYDTYKQVASANRAFYEAFEAFDLDSMTALWLHGAEVKCVHPGWDLLTGFEPVMASWKAIFENTDAIHFELVDLSIEVLGEVAWVTNVEQIRIGDGGEERAAALATNLYRKVGDEWLMVLHHASPLAPR